jgi:hypothetical protein
MGLPFQRRVKLLPGMHVNSSLFGEGVSVSSHGAHLVVTAHGQRYTSIGLIGVGLSWQPEPISSSRLVSETEREDQASRNHSGNTSTMAPVSDRGSKEGSLSEGLDDQLATQPT